MVRAVDFCSIRRRDRLSWRSRTIWRWRRISVIDAGDGRVLQRFELTEAIIPALAREADGLGLLDINFDGFVDLQILAFRPAGPNFPYVNWLFAPGADLYERAPKLDDITSPTLDPATQTIYSHWRSSYGHHGVSVYRWLNGAPTEVARRECQVLDAGGIEYQRWAPTGAGFAVVEVALDPGEDGEDAAYGRCLDRL